MPSILIFESDLAFANELQSEFIRRSCEVSVVDDATVGLQQAATNPPDLILLCTELPRMNGFSVCNRLKRDPELRQIPVIIMSANASEENFQQHRNLTNKRAEDYVHKPIAVDAMLERVERLIQLPGGYGLVDHGSPNGYPSDAEHGAGPAQEAASDMPELELGEVEDLDADDLLVDDIVDDLLAEPEQREASGTRHSAPAPVLEGGPADQDLDAVTENAFDALMASDSFTSGQAMSSAPPTVAAHPSYDEAVPAPAAVPSVIPAKPASHSPSSPPHDGRASDDNTRQALVQAQAELANAKERLAELEDELLREREKGTKLETLYVELDEAKARLASGGGNRAREVLDLREALNAKDKELLALRDQLTSKEKELLSTKDSALELERKTADAEERAVEHEKRAASLERAERAAQQDREQATKRADTYKRKQERLTEELTAARSELDDVENARQALSGQLAQLQQLFEQSEARTQDLTEKLDQSTAQVNQLQAEQRRVSEQLGHAQSALAEASSARDELQERVTQAQARVDALESERTQLASELSSVRSSLEQELETLRGSLEAEQQARSQLSQEHEAVQARLKAAEQQLDESQLQAAEQGEQLDRYRVAAGELGGLLTDAIGKLREIDVK